MTPWTAECQASLSFTISQNLFKLMSIELLMPSTHLILCHPLLLLPSIFPRVTVFSNESAFPIKWPKYWNFSFSISPSNEYSGLTFFRFDLFPYCPRESQESSPTPHFKNISSLALMFFIVQLSHLYMTTGKTIALATQNFIGKVMSLFFNMLSRFAIAFFQGASII